jgi:hypothetical protein
VAVRIGLSAHQVTLAALTANLGGAVAIGTGSRVGFVTGVALAHLGFWLDHVDGQVARWRGTASLDGVYLDYLMHHAANMALGFSLGFGMALRTGDPLWSVAGFAVAFGWAGLSLHNDCRYKAFFQRLKKDGRTFRVEGGSGGRPAPPAPWPHRGLRALTWPAYKACEPHVVLLCLTALAIISLVAPTIWLGLWRWCLRVTAIAAPLLAFARAVTSVRRGAAETEFGRWFQPLGPDEGEEHGCSAQDR